ncbi:MAG: class I SAM-dependent methyltransferase [Thermoplasmata archaeon]|nr:class I SAM-dependent methyltransferase [Thermoplasmata archaeon]MCI4356167.1 class I SAM-dependent methyltransferase [Thermoplasmata archaeon]
MKADQPSYSAERVAMMRAAHRSFDDPTVFDDPLALRILGPDAVDRLERTKPFARSPPIAGLRAWLAARSRFAEDELALARERGIRQYIVLGAGLDTFAYRQPPGVSPMEVFEVDHPATQEWKLLRLREGGIGIPPTVHFVATDFERGDLGRILETGGFRRDAPAFVSWLGVTMYLTRPAIDRTTDLFASLAPGSGVVLDYFAEGAENPLERVARGLLAERVALSGEPFRSWLPVGALARELEGRGFHDVLDLGADEVNQRYFADRSDGLKVVSRVGRLVRAVR